SFGISSTTSHASSSENTSMPSSPAAAPATAPAAKPSSPSMPRPIKAPTLLPSSIASSWLRLLRCSTSSSPSASLYTARASITRTVSLSRRRSSSAMISPWNFGWSKPRTMSWTGPMAMVSPLVVLAAVSAWRMALTSPGWGESDLSSRALGLERRAVLERPGVDGVEPEAVDQPRHRAERAAVVARRADRGAIGRPLGARELVELVVAELVEALHDARRREVGLDDRARAVRGGGELPVVAVDGRPVVHRVDEDLAGEQVARQL